MSRHLLPRFTRNAIRRIAGLVLTATMLCVTVSPTIAQAAVRDAVQSSSNIGNGAGGFVLNWSPKKTDLSPSGLATLLRITSAHQIFAALQSSTQRGADDGGRMPPRPPMGPVVTPQQAAPREEREGRISSLRLNTRDDIELQSQRIFLSAIPVDSVGLPVQGLRAGWKSNNSGVATINWSGEAVAGRPGTGSETVGLRSHALHAGRPLFAHLLPDRGNCCSHAFKSRQEPFAQSEYFCEPTKERFMS